MKQVPKRILVSPLRFIGDGILTVPLLRALRERYENAQIDLLLPSSMANLFERCPYISEILVRPASTTALYRLITSRQYDLGMMMRRSVSEALLFKLAGVKTRIGFDEQRFPPPLGYRRWGAFLDHALPFPPVNTDIPQVKTYLSLLKPLTAEPLDESLELWADETDKLRIAALFHQHRLEANQPVAVVHATSASREKGVSLKLFIPSLKHLYARGYQWVALGTETDRPYYDLLAREAQIPIANLCGETTLRQSYALMLKAPLLLSLDSSPIHMAAAAGVPHIIGIYGPTNEKQWRPYPYEGQFTPIVNTELACRPCIPKLCEHNRCRTDLSPLALQQAVEAHLSALEPGVLAPL